MVLHDIYLSERYADHTFALQKGKLVAEGELYAAGVILLCEGKVNFIAGALHDAANAVNKVKQFIEPIAKKAAMVSSHNEVFKEWNRELVSGELG